MDEKHIILIGFKHTGKSVVGKLLAEKLGRKFFDLDEQIELKFQKDTGQKMSCRQIMKEKGQNFFRNLEGKTLKENILNSPAVLALGGGSPIRPKNQELIKEHSIVWVSAPKSIVFERIMVTGRPAFFSPEETPLDSFNKLWEEREKVYKKLANFTVENSGSIEQAAENLYAKLILNI